MVCDSVRFLETVILVGLTRRSQANGQEEMFGMCTLRKDFDCAEFLGITLQVHTTIHTCLHV